MYVNTLGIQIEKSTYVFNIKIIPVPVPGKKNFPFRICKHCLLHEPHSNINYKVKIENKHLHH